MKHHTTIEYYPVIEQTHPIVQVAIGTVIAVIMTAVFFGFLVGTQS